MNDPIKKTNNQKNSHLAMDHLLFCAWKEGRGSGGSEGDHMVLQGGGKISFP